MRGASLALRRTYIKVPVAGVVASRVVQVGQHAGAGTPLMAVVPLDDVWVDANFKEVQLADLRVGQPVTLTADVMAGASSTTSSSRGCPPARASPSRCCRGKTDRG